MNNYIKKKPPIKAKNYAYSVCVVTGYCTLEKLACSWLLYRGQPSNYANKKCIKLNMWATLQCIRRKVSGGESLEKNISAFRWKWANNSSSVLSKQRIHCYCSDVYSKPTAFTLCILLPMHTLSSATVPLFCMYMNFCNVHLPQAWTGSRLLK